MDQVRIFIDAKKVGSENGATHRVGDVWLRIGDDHDAQEQLSKIVYEANRLKEPLIIREILGDTFALHFNIELMGEAAKAQALVKDVAKFVGQQLPEIFTGSNQYTCVIYAADIPEDGLTKAQLVWPDLRVDAARAGQLRSALLDKMDGPKGSPEVVQKMKALHPENNSAKVIKDLMQKEGVEMPLAATTRPPLRTVEAALNPVAMATISANAIQKKDAPGQEERWRWVQVGLKRRDQANPEMRKPTDWNAPRSYRKGSGKESGSSGKSSGGSGGTTGQGSSGGKYTTAKDQFKG